MSTNQPIWPSGRFGVPQITPFTYRDGHTHMELIEALRNHLVEQLHPSLVSTVNSLVEQMEREYGKALDQYVNGVEEFQQIHDRFMSDVNGALTALNDTAVSDLVEDETSLLGQVLRQSFANRDRVHLLSTIPQDYGAVADWDGSTGTDNAPAFQAALDNTPDGGVLFVPGGSYFFRSPIYLRSNITFTTGGSGSINSGSVGTELVFDRDIDGVIVEEMPSGVRPAKWKIGPLFIRSLNRGPGPGTGLLIRANRGITENVSVERFGTCGIHIVGGRIPGSTESFGGNANLNTLIAPRSFGNYGDGIRIEGNNAQANTLIRPDVIANHGHGMHINRSSSNKIISPHANHQVEGSLSAYRDNGHSNNWDWVYSEKGSPFVFGSNAVRAHVVLSAYGIPKIEYESAGPKASCNVYGLVSNSQSRLVMSNAEDQDYSWHFQVDSLTDGSFDLRRDRTGDRVWSVDADVSQTRHYTNQVPYNDDVSLGTRSRPWDEAHVNTLRAYDTIRLGSTLLRSNAGILERSNNDGVSWVPIALDR